MMSIRGVVVVVVVVMVGVGVVAFDV